jgi:hypothetical protein
MKDNDYEQLDNWKQVKQPAEVAAAASSPYYYIIILT